MRRKEKMTEKQTNKETRAKAIRGCRIVLRYNNCILQWNNFRVRQRHAMPLQCCTKFDLRVPTEISQTFAFHFILTRYSTPECLLARKLKTISRILS